jgi:coenzyme F420-0:L-glutamate ligase / coenzyme F420-1:gamma-L-glutamate ligase
MPALDLMQLIQTRRSLRRFSDVPIPDDLLEQILRAGMWAPSAHNRQPWRFAVVSTSSTKVMLASAMNARLRHDLQRDGVPHEAIEADVARSYDRLTSAPVLIVVCMSLQDMDKYGDERRNQHEWTMATQSVAMAGQNMLLMAHGLGLGACWMCAPLFCGDVVIATLNLPADWQPQGVIALGYSAQARQKERSPIETKVVWR